MSGGTNVIPGHIAKTPLNPGQPGIWVSWQFPHGGRSPVTGITDVLDGCFIAEPLVASPTTVESWEIVGFSAQLRIAANIDTVVAQQPQYWARFGNIWVGILKDIPLPTCTPGIPVWDTVRFPPDLSAFIKVWDGAEDPVAIVNGTTHIDRAINAVIEDYSLIAVSTVLPFPLTVQPGSQLAFAVIMTPSTVDAVVDFVIGDVQFAVNYNTISHRR